MIQTVWVHRTGDLPYAQSHLPTGGVALHWRLGGEPRLLGPLTGPVLEVIPAHTTIVGVRFWPGSHRLLAVAGAELLDQCVALRDLGHRWVDPLDEAMISAPTPESALEILQAQLLQLMGTVGDLDPLLAEAVRLLMPWQHAPVGTVARRLGLSTSQLRRRCVQELGISPKVLQRTLRFQGFLALAQAATRTIGHSDDGRLAGLATEVGYADQSHLSRECLRLAGVTPAALFGSTVDLCLHDHDHAGSYQTFLASRTRTPQRV